jgi:hypothetical protein
MQGKIRNIVTDEKKKVWKRHLLQCKAIWEVNEVLKHGEY